ncbi:MFS transporter [Streptomyces sp. SCUT-3]|uniref:MFS transporter n=1 Tax=Streptomyces sp. SCUT-3 TaxID=2684469 RepID=UPI0015FB4F98|nr:MFS transporter [Streptomyces sp. SCUT-3]QMV20942.1 MFS transporter [Streptomyces sp. SCUT-3]
MDLSDRPDSPGAAPRLRRARLAVVLLFLANALVYANLVPRFPEIRDSMGLSNTAMGAAIAAAPAGALLVGLSAGALGALVGSGRLAVLCGFGFAVVVPLLGLADRWWTLAGLLFLTGALDAVMDSAMNTHGLRVQRGYGRSILSGFHGVWSVGAVAGGLAGTAAAGLGVPLPAQTAAAGVVLALLAAAARPLLLPGSDDADHGPAPAAAGADTGDGADTGTGGRAGSGLRTALPVLLLLGLVLVMASVVEDTPASWGAALLRDDYAAPAAAAGLAYVAFQCAMTVGRFTGDRVTDRYGPVAVARVGGLLVAVPVGLALLSGSGAAVVAAFALAGLGAATLFPAALHAAGSIPGVGSGHGVAVVSWLARVGFLAAPPLVGLVGDRVGLRAGVSVVVVAGVLVVLLARVLSPAPVRPGAGAPSA